MKRVRRSCVRAFTLVEVILAILIISAIITVLLYFYQRSVEVRQAVLAEAEFLSVSRMLLEQITGELRTARVVEDQFIGLEGGSNTLTFVCTSIPQSARWITSSNETVLLPPLTDLKRVKYWLRTGTNFSTVIGVDRTEEFLTGSAFTAGTNSTEFVNSSGSNVQAEAELNLGATNETQIIRPPLSDRIKFLQFRYWSGTNWVDSWASLELPSGIEISLGKDAMPIEASSSAGTSTPGEEYPFELFRRVVYLPNSVPPENKVIIQQPAESY